MPRAATLTAGADNASSLFSGVLQNGTGPLALTKSGTGTLILTGTNTYTGGTTISGGTLQLGNAGATGSIVGNITDNGVLQFNRTDTGLTLSGNITGTGSVVQAGTGTVTLSGTNTYSGVTTVSAGTLQAGSVTGLSANSAFYGERGDLEPEWFLQHHRFFGRHRHGDRQRRRRPP